MTIKTEIKKRSRKITAMKTASVIDVTNVCIWMLSCKYRELCVCERRFKYDI